ncbi:CBS domain-containing protein [Streptacidiphilus sp. MAP12-16]|uniref:CBS domain-containing protein n=1 Tax=Streptacidiphilus sp. MAP12-16 TaxID=3156300 RepID=UPI00351995E7
MTNARDMMHSGAQSIPATETLTRAAMMMRQLNVGALPISDSNDRMCGIVTDRDIVVMCVAAGMDPAKMTCGELAQGTPRWISADADLKDVLDMMESHQIRRLPVVENKRLIGMISEADLAHHLTDAQLHEFVEKVYAGR